MQTQSYALPSFKFRFVFCFSVFFLVPHLFSLPSLSRSVILLESSLLCDILHPNFPHGSLIEKFGLSDQP